MFHCDFLGVSGQGTHPNLTLDWSGHIQFCGLWSMLGAWGIEGPAPTNCGGSHLWESVGFDEMFSFLLMSVFLLYIIASISG